MRNYGILEREIEAQTGVKVRCTPTPAKDAVILDCSWLWGEVQADGSVLIQESTKSIVILHEALDKYTLETIINVVREFLP